jgi:hypothetical protein
VDDPEPLAAIDRSQTANASPYGNAEPLKAEPIGVYLYEGCPYHPPYFSRGKGDSMRFLTGFILGIALTFVAAYVIDQREKSAEKKVVNWDVVGEKVDAATKDAQQVWSDFTREITGP